MKITNKFMRNQSLHKTSYEAGQAGLNAVSLSPDILAIIEETRVGAIEEMDKIGNYRENESEDKTWAYTMNDVIKCLEKMNSVEYKQPLELLKKNKIFNALVEDNEYTENLFKINIVDILHPEKKFELVKKVLWAWFNLEKPLKGWEYIREYTRRISYEIWIDDTNSIQMKKLARRIDDLVEIYSDYTHVDKKKIAKLKLLDRLSSATDPELRNYYIMISVSLDINYYEWWDGKTLLTYLVENREWMTAHEVLEAWADPDEKSFAWISAYEYLKSELASRTNPDPMIANFLESMKLEKEKISKIKNVADIISRPDWDDYFWSWDELWNMIDKTLNINARNENFETAFMKAVKNRDKEFMYILADAWADTSPLDMEFNTPLINAILEKDFEMAEWLLWLMDKEWLNKKGQNDKNALELAEEARLEGLAEEFKLRIKQIEDGLQ